MTTHHTSSHGHAHRTGVLGWIERIFHLHGHGGAAPAARTDPILATEEGIRTVWLALAVLGITAVLQLGIVWLSGSVALLADTVHNIGDTLNSIPLLFAFYLARRLPTRRYTYGFGRAEDIAGVLIVLSIAFSAAVIFWESFQKLLNPQPMTNLLWVAAAALVGFVGNEGVALLQIRVGRRIGSAAMVADGQHARTDGFTSLAVLGAVLGTWLGFPLLDPLLGIGIGVAILCITWDASKTIWYRLMDAVDPQLVDRLEELAAEVAGVTQVAGVQARWVGHELHAVIACSIPESSTQAQAQAIVAAVQQNIQAHLGFDVVAQVTTALPVKQAEPPLERSGRAILPPQYRSGRPVSAAPMGAAALRYKEDGSVAWDEIWTGYCELALAGGPPHRGTLLEPADPEEIAAAPQAYAAVLAEIERGLTMVTGLPVVADSAPGWIGLVCTSEAMALWLLRAIVVENVSVRREGQTLFFPVSPRFRLEREIKSIITVTAKTTHYWQEHAQGGLLAE